MQVFRGHSNWLVTLIRKQFIKIALPKPAAQKQPPSSSITLWIMKDELTAVPAPALWIPWKISSHISENKKPFPEAAHTSPVAIWIEAYEIGSSAIIIGIIR